MPLTAYIGLQGNGKTYEVVTVVIMEALRAGRRVVTNVAGLNYDLYFSMLTEQGIAPDKIGELVTVEHDQVKKTDFWLTDDDLANNRPKTLKPGDLLALDEIWRFWDGFSPTDADGNKRPVECLNFLRMHRHMVSEKTGLTCEIAFITQDLSDLHRSFKNVVDQTYLMTKHTALGSTKRYRVDIYQRYNIRKKPINSLQKSYDPKMFPLYSSHSQAKEGGAKAKEQRIDTRGNLLAGKRFVLFIPLLLLGMGFSIWKLNEYAHPKPKTEAKPLEIPTPSQASVVPAQLPAPVVPEPKKTWRIVGFYTVSNVLTLLLRDDQGTTRYVVDPPNIRLAGLDIGAVLDTEAYSNWSGPTITGNSQALKP